MDRRIVAPLALIVVLVFGIVGAAALTGGGEGAGDEARPADEGATGSTSSTSSTTSTSSTSTTTTPAGPAADPASAGNGDEPYVEVPCTDGTMCGEITTQPCEGEMCGEIAPQGCPPGSSDCGDVPTQPCTNPAMCGDIQPRPDDSPL